MLRLGDTDREGDGLSGGSPGSPPLKYDEKVPTTHHRDKKERKISKTSNRHVFLKEKAFSTRVVNLVCELFALQGRIT